VVERPPPRPGARGHRAERGRRGPARAGVEAVGPEGTISSTGGEFVVSFGRAERHHARARWRLVVGLGIPVLGPRQTHGRAFGAPGRGLKAQLPAAPGTALMAGERSSLEPHAAWKWCGRRTGRGPTWACNDVVLSRRKAAVGPTVTLTWRDPKRRPASTTLATRFRGLHAGRLDRP